MSLDNLTPSEFLRWFQLGQAVRRGAVKEATMYSYNGVVLPGLPVVSGYEYAFMDLELSADGDYYYGVLTLSTKPMEYTSVGSIDYLAATEDCSYIQYIINDPSPDWVISESGDAAQGEKVCFVHYSYKWANHDIPDIVNGGTFVEGSDPIPVYE